MGRASTIGVAGGWEVSFILGLRANPVPGRDRVLAIRGYRSRGRVVIADENTPFGLWHVLAARGDARPPRMSPADAPWVSAAWPPIQQLNNTGLVSYYVL